jgi:hypothetical protein
MLPGFIIIKKCDDGYLTSSMYLLYILSSGFIWIRRKDPGGPFGVLGEAWNINVLINSWRGCIMRLTHWPLHQKERRKCRIHNTKSQSDANMNGTGIGEV